MYRFGGSEIDNVAFRRSQIYFFSENHKNYEEITQQLHV